jgi:hypothetical protein
MGFQIGFPALRNYPPSGVTYDPDVQTWMDARAAVGDAVPTAYANAVNQYVLDLKAISGHWDTITQLYVYAGATTVAGGLVPIKGLTQTHSNLDDADFALKTGVTGNGTDEHIITGYTGTSFSQNSVHAYALVTAAPTAGTRSIFGHSGTAIGALNFTWNVNTRCHSTTGNSFTGTSVGGYGVSRSNSADYDRMVAGSVTNVTQASQAPATGDLLLLGRTSNTNVPQLWFDGRVLVWACGSGNTLANYTTPGNDLQTALNAI